MHQKKTPGFVFRSGNVREDRQGGGRGGLPQRGRGLPRRPGQQHRAVSSGEKMINEQEAP